MDPKGIDIKESVSMTTAVSSTSDAAAAAAAVAAVPAPANASSHHQQHHTHLNAAAAASYNPLPYNFLELQYSQSRQIFTNLWYHLEIYNSYIVHGFCLRKTPTGINVGIYGTNVKYDRQRVYFINCEYQVIFRKASLHNFKRFLLRNMEIYFHCTNYNFMYLTTGGLRSAYGATFVDITSLTCHEPDWCNLIRSVKINQNNNRICNDGRISFAYTKNIPIHHLIGYNIEDVHYSLNDLKENDILLITGLVALPKAIRCGFIIQVSNCNTLFVSNGYFDNMLMDIDPNFQFYIRIGKFINFNRQIFFYL